MHSSMHLALRPHGRSKRCYLRLCLVTTMSMQELFNEYSITKTIRGAHPGNGCRGPQAPVLHNDTRRRSDPCSGGVGMVVLELLDTPELALLRWLSCGLRFLPPAAAVAAWLRLCVRLEWPVVELQHEGSRPHTLDREVEYGDNTMHGEGDRRPGRRRARWPRGSHRCPATRVPVRAASGCRFSAGRRCSWHSDATLAF
jgi:hypothetical protein